VRKKRVGSGGAEERGSWKAQELRKNRELIIFGYKTQEIPPKISFTPGNRIKYHVEKENEKPVSFPWNPPKQFTKVQALLGSDMLS